MESSESCNLRFEDLRISYTNLINKAHRRKSDLKDQYYFNCTCDRCNIDKSEHACVITKTTLQLNELAKEGSLLCRNCKSCIPVGTQQGKYIHHLQNIYLFKCNSTKLTIYCNLSSFIEEYNNGSASCKQCGYKTSPEQIKKHKQYTQEMISTIIENRGGHPEPMEQVILSTVIVFESKLNYIILTSTI